VSVSPASLNFPGQLLGSTGAAQHIKLRNTGDAALSISGIGSSGDFIQSNNCGSNLAGFGGMLPCAPWFARRELDCLREIYFHKLGTNLNVMGGIWRAVAM